MAAKLEGIRGELSCSWWICNNITTYLEHLSLADSVRYFPPSISNFKHLTSLVFTGNTGVLPESIGSLLLLQKLVLSPRRGRIALPFSASKLTALENLTLLIDEEDIAPSLQHVPSLTELNLTIKGKKANGLLLYTSYPDYIWNLTFLKL